MNKVYGRDLDLNLMRVFVVVAEAGSVTAAADRLYLTQPAISAALKRLASTVGHALFARQGRGLVLTSRGARLLTVARPHLEALVEAALSPPGFDPLTSERTFRIGLADACESWLLPPLLRVLEREAPRLRLIVLPVQFRTVGEALAAQKLDLALSVADEVPAGILRRPLFLGGFRCLFDPRHVRLAKRPTLKAYLEHGHVIVSYNGDLRGVVEDTLGLSRRVRCSVASFHSVGPAIHDTALVATVPELVARQIIATYPRLRSAPLPFRLAGTPLELLWRAAVDGDEACRFLREHVVRLVGETTRPSRRGPGAPRAAGDADRVLRGASARPERSRRPAG